MVVIVDYGIGNLSSIKNMLKKAGIESVMGSDTESLKSASAIILPGMGHFDHCMKRFNESGLRSTIEEKVFDNNTPVLGICVGLQMMMDSSEEGIEPGLSWISGKTIKLKKMDAEMSIPHMGWQPVIAEKNSAILEELDESRFYFAHSFHVLPENNEDVLLTSEYGYKFPVAIERNNIIGVQFHPEKSHRFGMRLLSNFVNYYH